MIVATWVFVAIVARSLLGSWWQPGAILSLIMAANGVGTATFAPDYTHTLTANIVLMAFVSAAVVGNLVAITTVTRPRPPVTQLVRPGRQRLLLALGYVSGFTALIGTASSIGLSVAGLTSLGQLAGTAQSATRTRYVEGLDLPLYTSLATALFLVFAILTTMDQVGARRVKLQYAPPFALYFLANLLITTRAPILWLLAIMTFAVVFTVRAKLPGDSQVRFFSRRGVLSMVLLGLAVGGLFYYLQALRFGAGTSSAVVWQRLRIYQWGNLAGFSIWFEQGRPIEADQPPGFYTFMGILDNLGLADRIPGAYNQFYRLGFDGVGNIYTAYRGLIHDFGYVGSLLFASLLGYVGGRAFARQFTEGVSLCCYVAVAAFFSYSFIASLFAYTAILLAFLMTPVLLRFFMTDMGGDIRATSAASTDRTSNLGRQGGEP